LPIYFLGLLFGMEENFLTSARQLFGYYRELGKKTLDQVPDEQLFWTPGAEGDSLAVIVKHLHGNMLSRWTDFLESDGEKEWRERDDEFVGDLDSRAEVERLYAEGWDCVEKALNGLEGKHVGQLVYIRNQGHAVLEAIQRQLGHYAYHIGQMVLLGKLLVGDDWTSLSIPRGESKTFNAQKFSQEASRKHFTEDN